MRVFIRLLANVPLRGKIFGVCFFFLAVMAIIAALGGYALVKQNQLLENAVRLASDRVLAASSAKISITSMDKAIQQLIAADQKKSIKIAAIGSIRAGSYLEENLQKLEQTYKDSPDVQHLIQLVSEIRPIQLKIIKLGQQNKDDEALQISAEIGAKIDEINQLSDRQIKVAEEDLSLSLQQARDGAMKLIITLGIALAMGVALGVAISIMAVRMMNTPLVQIESLMTSLARGDLTKEIDTRYAGTDEIGSTLLAIEHTVNKLKESFIDIDDAVENVQQVAQHVVDNADEIQSSNTNLNGYVEKMLANSNTVSSTTEQSGNVVSEVSVNAEKSAQLAENSAHLIQQSVDQFTVFQDDMNQTATQSKQLLVIAEKISTITQTITGISEQTNLLALNAAIEAARAGEHGRGFAVVADEVRSLASNTSQAAEEISDLIKTVTDQAASTSKSMQGAVENADSNIDFLREAAEKTGESHRVAKEIKAVMNSLVEISKQQQSAISEIHQAIGSLSDLSQVNQQKSDDLRNLSGSLGNSSDTLVNAVKHFKLN